MTRGEVNFGYSSNTTWRFHGPRVVTKLGIQKPTSCKTVLVGVISPLRLLLKYEDVKCISHIRKKAKTRVFHLFFESFCHGFTGMASVLISETCYKFGEMGPQVVILNVARVPALRLGNRWTQTKFWWTLQPSLVSPTKYLEMSCCLIIGATDICYKRSPYRPHDIRGGKYTVQFYGTFTWVFQFYATLQLNISKVNIALFTALHLTDSWHYFTNERIYKQNIRLLDKIWYFAMD